MNDENSVRNCPYHDHEPFRQPVSKINPNEEPIERDDQIIYPRGTFYSDLRSEITLEINDPHGDVVFLLEEAIEKYLENSEEQISWKDIINSVLYKWLSINVPQITTGIPISQVDTLIDTIRKYLSNDLVREDVQSLFIDKLEYIKSLYNLPGIAAMIDQGGILGLLGNKIDSKVNVIKYFNFASLLTNPQTIKNILNIDKIIFESNDKISIDNEKMRIHCLGEKVSKLTIASISLSVATNIVTGINYRFFLTAFNEDGSLRLRATNELIDEYFKVISENKYSTST